MRRTCSSFRVPNYRELLEGKIIPETKSKRSYCQVQKHPYSSELGAQISKSHCSFVDLNQKEKVSFWHACEQKYQTAQLKIEQCGNKKKISTFLCDYFDIQNPQSPPDCWLKQNCELDISANSKIPNQEKIKEQSLLLNINDSKMKIPKTQIPVYIHFWTELGRVDVHLNHDLYKVNLLYQINDVSKIEFTSSYLSYFYKNKQYLCTIQDGESSAICNLIVYCRWILNKSISLFNYAFQKLKQIWSQEEQSLLLHFFVRNGYLIQLKILVNSSLIILVVDPQNYEQFETLLIESPLFLHKVSKFFMTDEQFRKQISQIYCHYWFQHVGDL